MAYLPHILVTGAGGFIGHPLVKRLVETGHVVRAVDLKLPDYQPSPAQSFELLDLRRVLDWIPQIPLERGLEITDHWVHAQLAAQGRVPERIA